MPRGSTLRPAPAPPPLRRRSLTLALVQVGVVAVLAGLAELALFFSGNPDPPPWQATIFVFCAWVFATAGIVAWWRRPGSRIGLLMTAGAFAWLAAGLINGPVPALTAVGQVTQTLPIALLVHLVVAFPSGRLDGRAERVAVGVIYVITLVLQAPEYLLVPGPLQVATDASLLSTTAWIRSVTALATVAAAFVLVVRRLRDATPAQRRARGPVMLYGMVAVAALPLGTRLFDLAGWDGSPSLPVIQGLIVAGVPLAFALGIARGGFAPTRNAAELGAWLGLDETERPALPAVLAAALGDPTVELLYRVPGDDRWVNGAGVATLPPTASDRRGVSEVQLGGRTIGAIVYDATQVTRPDEIDDVARVVALALDRERLTVELRASRVRLVEAGDAERRRLAGDLHDGLQSRLVLLAIQAGVAPNGDPALREGLDAAIDELRALVHGVMPAALTERGLPAAVRQLADRMPIAVTLDVRDGARRPSPAVESTGYFVTSEAMTNAVKHAHASELCVTIAWDAQWLRIEVHDDGIGGAGYGGGIRSIVDRVEALGGMLRIESPVGAGTHVEVELPCAS